MTDQIQTPDGWKAVPMNGFISHLGPMLRSVETQGLFALQTDDRHENSIGLVHGGVLTSLLDQVMANTAWSACGKQPMVTIQMDTRFVGAAKAGDFLTSKATIRQATRSLVFVDADVDGPNGPVATATAIMKFISRSGPAK